MQELELNEQQVFRMVCSTVRGAELEGAAIFLTASPSYGDHKHRTWVFMSDEMIGTIERYWGGLKMICSVLGEPPRTYFFTEDGRKSSNKALKGFQ
jgi:hypothetical protein